MAKQREATQEVPQADTLQPEQTTAASSSSAPPDRKNRTVPKRVMYVGPTVVEGGHVFSYGQIFSNGLPDYWMEKAAAEPEFRQLLVTIDNVGKSLADMRDRTSMLAQAEKKVRANNHRRIRKAREGK